MAEEDKKTEEKEETKADVPAKFKKLVEDVEKMTVIELNELVKTLEERFGVSAQATVVAGAVGAEATGDDGEDKTVTVELTDAGAQKIQVIKVVKELLGLGLKEAKDLVDGVPSIVKEGVKKEEAAEIEKQITGAGGKVTLK